MPLHPRRQYRVETHENRFTGYVELDSALNAVVVYRGAHLKLDPGYIDADGRLKVPRNQLSVGYHSLVAVVLGPCEIFPETDDSGCAPTAFDTLPLVVEREPSASGWWGRITEPYKILTSDDELV